jgi:hypothetical protein
MADVGNIENIIEAARGIFQKYGLNIGQENRNAHPDTKSDWECNLRKGDVYNPVSFTNKFTSNGRTIKASVKMVQWKAAEKFTSIQQMEAIIERYLVNDLHLRPIASTPSHTWAMLEKLTAIAMHLHACKQQSLLT